MERLQKEVKEFIKRYKLKYKSEITALDLVSEIGKEFLIFFFYKKRSQKNSLVEFANLENVQSFEL